MKVNVGASKEKEIERKDENEWNSFTGVDRNVVKLLVAMVYLGKRLRVKKVPGGLLPPFPMYVICVLSPLYLSQVS